MTHVDWHKVPKDGQSLLVTYINEDGEIKVTEDTYFKGRFTYCQGELDCKVLAWAELPEPYQPPEPLDMHPDAIATKKLHNE